MRKTNSPFFVRRSQPVWWRAMVLGIILVALPSSARAALHSDEAVLLYPAIAKPVASGFEISLHGIVYEPERRPLMTWMVRQLTGLEREDLTPAEWEIFNARCRYFLVDHERGKRITLRWGGEKLAAATSAANGHFETQFTWNTNVLRAQSQTNGVFSFAAVLDETGQRKAPVDVHVLAETGLSVISDIDDTIKISEVLDREALLRNTFCRAFKPVPGMAELYAQWSADLGAQFHYVTASPWQLYQPLSEFVREHHFPRGTFHMKNFRIKDRSAIDLFTSPERYKPGVIEPLLRRFPKRQFVLVGDSGEKDPDIYAELARRFPKQVRLVLIREVHEEVQRTRYQKIFENLPANRWRVFKDPVEIKQTLGTTLNLQ